MIAGSDTTSNTFGWIFQYLLENPDVKAKLIEEIDSVLNTTDDVVPSLEQLSQMTYTQAVVKETLRLKVRNTYASVCSSISSTIILCRDAITCSLHCRALPHSCSSSRPRA